MIGNARALYKLRIEAQNLKNMRILFPFSFSNQRSSGSASIFIIGVKRAIGCDFLSCSRSGYRNKDYLGSNGYTLEPAGGVRVIIEFELQMFELSKVDCIRYKYFHVQDERSDGLRNTPEGRGSSCAKVRPQDLKILDSTLVLVQLSFVPAFPRWWLMYASV